MALWTPAEITTALWLDAADSDTITLDTSDNVEQWDDKSGNDHHVSNTINRPSIALSAIDSKNAVSFDGSEWLESPALFSTIPTGVSIFIVVKPTGYRTGSPAFHAMVAQGSLVGGDFQFSLSADAEDSPVLSVNARAVELRGPETHSIGNVQLLEALAESGTYETATNSIVGKTSTSTNFDPSGSASFRVGHDGDTRFLIGEIAEIIITSNFLSISDRETVQGYLAWKWGLEANLPSDHPYKDDAPVSEINLTSTNIETSPAVISSPSSISENRKFNNFRTTQNFEIGDWAYRIPLTIDSTKIDSDLTHFPVPIVLTGTDAEAVISELDPDPIIILKGNLLIHSDTTDGSTVFTDSSPSDQTITAPLGNIIHSSAKSVFGATSIYFNVSGYLSVASSSNFAFGTEDFTIDFWINGSMEASNEYVFDIGTNGCVIQLKSGRICYYDPTVGISSYLHVGGPTLSPNTWYHVAIVRASGIMSGYVGGVSWASVSNTRNFAASALTLGAYGGTKSYKFTGYIDEFRIIKGTAVWTENFIPPNEPYRSPNSKKIKVVNGSGTELYCEIEQWDTVNDKITLWVSRSTWVISSTEDETIYLYYDSTQADNITYVGDPGDTAAQNVWNSDFVARYGMAQDPSGGTDCIIDSTVNANHGTPNGSMTSDDLVDGEIGKGIEFDGADDHIGDTVTIVNDYVTLQAVINTTTTAKKGILAGDYDVSNINRQFQFRINNGKFETIFFADSVITSVSLTNVNDGSNHLLHGVHDGSNDILYVDGIFETANAHTGILDSSPGPVRIGFGRDPSYFSGIIDEVRISSIAHSADWIKADYHAQTNTFLTVGSSEVSTASNFSYWKTRPSNRWKNYTAIYIEDEEDFPVLLITEPYGNRPTPTDIMNLEYGIKLGVDLEEQFGLKLAGEFNEDYSITQTITQEIEETYGIKLTLDIMEWYSDTPVRKKVFNEYYDDARIAKRAIVLRYKDSSIPILLTNEMYSDIPWAASVIWEIYNDAPQALRMLEEKYKDAPQSKASVILRYNDSLAAKSYIVETYDTAKALKLITSEKYSISGNQVKQSYPELYNIEALNKVSKPFDEKYYILPDSPAVSTVNVSVTIDETEIDFIGLDIDISIDKYAILGSIQLATEEDYLLCKYMSEVVCIVEGETFNFFLENKTKTTEHSSGIVYTVELVSPTVKLDAPYSSSIIESFPDGIYAETLINQMAAIQGITVDYQILDWFIPGYAISINDETPLSVIRRVVNAAGAVIQTKPDGTLLIISKYEVSPKDWKDYEATEIVSSTDSITYFTESLQVNNGHNAFLVTDQGSSSSNITLREINVDSNTKIIRGFRIPFADGEFPLLTSGGELVTIDKDVDPVEENVPIADLDGTLTEEWEYVEFIDWVGRTNYPIYELIDSDWEEDDLGAFQISEDGTLTIINQDSVPSESLLRIKYKTKYWKWTVTGVEGKHVQFYVPEEVE